MPSSRAWGYFAGPLLACAVGAGSAHAEIYRWLQYGPAGLEARATTDEAGCPSVSMDGQPATMAVRAAPGEQFAITVCTLSVPPGTQSLAIEGVPLPVPGGEPQRIVVIGDTGCRLKGSYIQACNDPEQWPFRQVTEAAAQQKPDLVIHVGDYHYRETPCPPGVTGCAGSPFGDTWAVWRADFFSPAETLLRTAPLVPVRGNHEECARGGRGWSRALAPEPFAVDKGCNGPSSAYVVRLPGLTLAVFDVSSAREDKADERQVAAFREQYAALARTTDGPTWILQHRPIWSPGGAFGGKLLGDSRTLEAAAKDVIPPNVTTILSGHHHLFQVLTYRTGQPVQIVAGHGGDTLNDPSPIDPAAWTMGPVEVESGINLAGRFGFAMLEKQADGWRLTNHDKLGAPNASCLLVGRRAAC
jgi:hypothetical protein